ncbi:probable dolichyl pyrophosphate Glc1Man9GlcNAc2 alpha-1,3-glucosyltransferase [Macadamia integrifolia]|uniref:probable dolichyl pyrophosphate Glc1Man9GlcNAc2 alpha-1,3-glucosyltransferase n=1 Tax=Macadamia integrifolia TaxID=60698 RepID=UPI001C4FF086|nr:probable dolichyl pyrophosphate Glc1Man9GlcNAc2 alpha-1,3-glucosyltransferase [Macadamia integrifolia]
MESKHEKDPKRNSFTAMEELAWFAGVATCVKLLLIPSYRSTDFEVHRNWLALTFSRPLSQWYSDETSPWTLDYPPLFAYFERVLSVFANLVDPKIVDLHGGLNYSADSVVYFQRISVIVSDLCLFYGVYRLTRSLDSIKRRLVWVLIVWSPALIIVDHMHFQYNGFLLGFLLISLSFLEEGRDLLGGFFFAVLLCFKHLFAVAAPVYFVYLLRHYCRRGLVRGFGRFLMMGAVVGFVFVVSFGPFLYHGQIHQVLGRMFPFGRGLCHAYWAPNFWVFYIILDKVLAFLLAKLGFKIQAPTASFTGGLVGDSSPYAVLPRVTPLVTFVLVLTTISPCLVMAWKKPRPGMITRYVAYAYTCGFLFGWHVHEKASLHFVVPLAIVAMHSLEDARHYFLLSIVSCYSLFPLLFEAKEYPIKVLLLLLHSLLIWAGFSFEFGKTAEAKTSLAQKKDDRVRSKRDPAHVKEGQRIVCWVGMCYLLGLLFVDVWCQFLHPYFLGDRLPFLPLMLISIYCALGITYSWIWQLRWIVRCQ